MRFLILIFLLFLGCDTVKEIWGLDFQYIHITLDTTDRLVYGKDGSGFYHIEYESNAVYYVRYETKPNKTVVWGIPDNPPVNWQGFNYEHPIISYSAHADGYGCGAQLYYLDETMIGDTLSIFGTLDIDSAYWSGLMIIVDDIVYKVSP